MILRLRVTPGHRFAELSLINADGSKRWIDQGPRYTVVDTNELAAGQEYTIRRYQQEGRFQVKQGRARRRAPKPPADAQNAPPATD